ncbi:MAG: hypothetical protein FWE03_01315 [Firmicutes bacterium]|nr:hypothetical protein [Bacillota bacterium]
MIKNLEKKRPFKILMICLLALIIIFPLSACDLFGDDNQPPPATVSVVLVDGDDYFTAGFEIGQIAELELEKVTTRQGYFLQGYFSDISGGARYLDSAGRSLEPWGANFPQRLYAQWGQISELKHYSEVFAENGVVLQGNNLSGSTNFDFTFSDEVINAIRGNLDRQIRISLTLQNLWTRGPMLSGITLNMYDRIGAGATRLVSDRRMPTSRHAYNYWHNLSAEFVLDALSTQQGALRFVFSRGFQPLGAVHLRNIQASIEFVNVGGLD